MPKKKKRKLTGQQERFCQLYTKYWNASRAAKEAGYSEKSADQIGYELLQNPLVQERIKQLTEPALKEIGVSRERVLTELSRIAFVNMKDLATWNESGVRFKCSEAISEDHAAAISEVSETVTESGGTLKIKQHDKIRALESLSKIAGYAPDRIEHSGPNGKPIEHKNLSELTDEQLQAQIAAYMLKKAT